MKSIIIVIPYFGKLPPIFKFWRQSAINNPTIDFLFFTDCNIQSTDNIKVIKCTFEVLREKFQSRFDFPISLPSPYKLCDFKATYGYVFQDYIQDYDFGDSVILI